MTTRFKDFGAGDVDETPLSFKLHDEEFHCRPAIQGATLLKMVTEAESDDGATVANVITSFFSKTLMPESYERFDVLINDPDRIVTVETLGEISGWLVEEYTKRPTKEPERS